MHMIMVRLEVKPDRVDDFLRLVSFNASESRKESSKPNSRDSMSNAAPDLPNLTHTLGICSTGHSSPEPQAPKKSPAPSMGPSVSTSPQMVFTKFLKQFVIGTP